jgi:hypothetical protein
MFPMAQLIAHCDHHASVLESGGGAASAGGEAAVAGGAVFASAKDLPSWDDLHSCLAAVSVHCLSAPFFGCFLVSM